MSGRVVGVRMAVILVGALVAALVAVGLFAWPGLPEGGDPYAEFRPALQSPGEVTELLGNPDTIERNCWFYLDRDGIDELRVCFGPRGRVAWSSRSGQQDVESGQVVASGRPDEEPLYPGDPGQAVEFGEFSIVRPQNWGSWTLYGGPKQQGLQIVSEQVREAVLPGEADPVKAMVGDQVAVTLAPAGRLSQRDDMFAITRDDLLTEGAKVPRGRAILDRLLCRGGGCFYLHVEFATRQPSDDLLDQVNRLVGTLERVPA